MATSTRGEHDELDYGSEVRGEAVQTVHGDHEVPESGPDYTGAGDPVEGMVVALDDDGYLKAADANEGNGGTEAFGVLYTYQYFGDSSRDGPYVRTDRPATVAVGGKLKVHVESGVSAGDSLAVGDSGGSGVPGVLTAATDDTSNFMAVTDARQQGTRPDSSDAYYAEVLIR